MVRDLLYGVRLLRRAPGFAIVAILTLGLGIGGATAVFSVVDGVLLAPLPYPEPERLVRLFQIDDRGRRMGAVSEPNFRDWQNGATAFRAMVQTSFGPGPVIAGGETLMLSGGAVSGDFFRVTGVMPAIGRPFSDGDQHFGAAPTAVISDRLWRSHLRAQSLDTLRLQANGVLYQVIGVMPPGFDFPSGQDYWFPRGLTAPQTARTAHNWTVYARLADNVPLERAVSEISAVSRALKQQHGDATWMADATALPLGEQLTAASRPTILLLFAASLVLLVIACLNVSNLQLARAATRRRELAVRLAVGAGRGRLVRQLLAEALVLSLAAAATGLGLAVGGIRLLVALQPSNLPRLDNVEVAASALLFASGTAVLTALVLALLTALRATKQEMRSALSEGTRTMAGGKASERVRQGLVVTQVALTIVLLAGAGLLARSFVNVMSVDPGFQTASRLLVETQWPFASDPGVQQRRKALQQELLQRLAALPGVEQAGLVNAHPLGTGGFANGQFLEMTRVDELQSLADFQRLGASARDRQGMAGYRIVSDGYFAAMGIPLLRGRWFDDGDGPDAPHVALVSASLAAAQWPGQDPIGRFIQFGNMDGDLRGFRIIGVVGDVREVSPESVPGPLFYANYRQRMASRFTLIVRSDAGTALAPTVRQLVREADPELPVQMRSMDDAFDRALAGRRFSLTLIAVFGATALVLASLGLYGLVAYLVAERTREIGIRLALGAEAADVWRLVVGKGVLLTVAGSVIGLGLTLAATRMLEGMLFGVTATDPIALAAVTAVTLLAVLAATIGPARRAMRVSPVVAMRAD